MEKLLVLGVLVSVACIHYVTADNIPMECALRSDSCNNCVKNASCLWCETATVRCMDYPKKDILPHKDLCDLGDARWGVCWMNYKVLLIVMGVLAGVLLISLTCCIYCCCCRRKKNGARYAQEEARIQREREERQTRHSERRSERESRMDEIRRKYGLGGKDGSRYERFDNEA